MPVRWLLITGTDTGVGKTVLTTLLVRHLVDQRQDVVAFKPVASGSRADARTLAAALQGRLSLDQVNPWSFRKPLAPVLAARVEHRQLRLPQVVRHLHHYGHDHTLGVVEGAGGLLSPLGERFDSRDLLLALRAVAVIAVPNRLGAVNQARLVLDALPPHARRQARVVLMNPAQPDRATRTNAALLAEFLPHSHLVELPWLLRPLTAAAARRPEVRAALERLLAGTTPLHGSPRQATVHACGGRRRSRE